MSQHQPRDPDFAARVHRSFGRQPFMTLLGARLTAIGPGAVEIELPLRPDLEQQHGYAHAGAAWSIADSAAGYAAQSLMTACCDRLPGWPRSILGISRISLWQDESRRAGILPIRD